MMSYIQHMFGDARIKLNYREGEHPKDQSLNQAGDCTNIMQFVYLISNIFIMNNQRYDKLNALIYLQNQKSHYKRIIEAKKNISFDEQAHIYTMTHLNNKYSRIQDQERRNNNLKLVMKIGEINNGRGALQKVRTLANRTKSVKSGKQWCQRDYQHRIMESQLNADNLRIAEKIRAAKPMIGTKRQWNSHFKAVKSFQKKLRKHSLSKEYDPQHKLKETLSSFKKMDSQKTGESQLKINKVLLSHENSETSLMRNNSNGCLEMEKRRKRRRGKKTNRVTTTSVHNRGFSEFCQTEENDKQ